MCPINNGGSVSKKSVSFITVVSNFSGTMDQSHGRQVFSGVG